MFGEVYMLGTSKHNIDYKGRIMIPKDTKVEYEDTLVIINKDTFLEIWHLNLIKNKIMEFEEKRDQAENIEEFEYYQNLINYITANTLHTSIVDKERRISIGENYQEKLKEFNNNEVIIERMGQYARIWPAVSFKNYKDETNKKRVKKK